MMPNDDVVPPPPQPAAPPRFALNPVPASVLAANEARRLDAAARLGRLRTGCGGVDDHVLLGGLERGCVVGLSAEEEDGFGVPVCIPFFLHPFPLSLSLFLLFYFTIVLY